jgi:hypothetical protein
MGDGSAARSGAGAQAIPRAINNPSPIPNWYVFMAQYLAARPVLIDQEFLFVSAPGNNIGFNTPKCNTGEQGLETGGNEEIMN